MTAAVVSICAWCPDKAQREADAKAGGAHVSHGICARCAKLVERTHELMLNDDASAAYVAIYANSGICPKCGHDTKGCEAAVVEHARLKFAKCGAALEGGR